MKSVFFSVSLALLMVAMICGGALATDQLTIATGRLTPTITVTPDLTSKI